MRPIALATTFALLAAPMAAQAPRPTPEKAEALVKAAIAYGKKNGMEKLFEETNAANGRFHAGPGAELYIFIYDQTGIMKAIGYNTAALVGKNRLELKDPKGKAFVKEFLAMAKAKGSGWVDYMYENPVTKAVEEKTSYVEMCEGYVIGAGVYKR